MDDDEFRRRVKEVQRASPWFAPGVILLLLSNVVGAVYVYGKEADHIESLDSRVKAMEDVKDATFSQKDAGTALGNLKDQITDLQKRDERLEQDVRSLLIEIGPGRDPHR